MLGRRRRRKRRRRKRKEMRKEKELLGPRERKVVLCNMRRHGWQLPLHPLQVVAMAVFIFLVVAFYVFLGPFLGNRVVENTVITVFSFMALSVAVLFVRCTAIDPSDRTSVKKKKKRRGKGKQLLKLNYRFILTQIVVRFFRRVENKILRCCIRRRYLDPSSTSIQFEPLLPFPLVDSEDVVAPHLKDDDISFCSLCDFEVKLHSKHCRSCSRCVEGFDHHCKWLNNCIGRRNYTTFILLMVFVLLMLFVEGGTAIAIFVCCFADKKRMMHQLDRKLHIKFPTGVLAAISILLALMTAYCSAALGQLFFFHVVLIRKGMRTYDYILAMREEQELIDPFDESDSSDDESIDIDSQEKPSSVSRFLSWGSPKMNQSMRRLSIKIEGHPVAPPAETKKGNFQIDPWKLLKMSKEKVLLAREKITRQKQTSSKATTTPMRPLPLEIKHGPQVNTETKNVKPAASTLAELTPAVPRGWFPGSPSWQLSSPRRRFSGSLSPRPQRYRSNFDLKLTEVSRELETHISRQVLCSVLRKEEQETCSPS